MELNGTEVDLINQIEKKYRKEINYGNWYEFKGQLYLYRVKGGNLRASDCIPVWTVSDCLEFLKNRNYYYSIYDQVGNGTVIDISLLVDGQRSMQDQLHGQTLLEVCLLAVLVVLEDKGIAFEKGQPVYQDDKGNLIVKPENKEE